MRTDNDRLTAEELREFRKMDFTKQTGLVSADSLLAAEHGAVGTPEREEFNAKAKAWYYGEVLRNRRKELGITQKQLAERVGRERTYVNRVERGETDMQLSSFLRIAAALGLALRLDATIA